MSNDIDTLASLDRHDVLEELQRRVEQMEASEAGGYGAAIEFYKRIIARIEEADDIAIDALDRTRRHYKEVIDLDAPGTYSLAKRMFEDIDTIDMRLRKFEDQVEIEPLREGEEFIYTPNGSHVYVSKIWKEGRWEYAELRFVDGDEMFNSDELVHYVVGPKADEYGFWHRLSNA